MEVLLVLMTLALVGCFCYYQQRKYRALMKTLERVQSRQTQLKTQLEKTQKDPLTGLNTWPVFEEHLQHAANQSLRYDFTLGVMYVDLDGFKVLNNALGNHVGDALLQETARRLKTCIRQADSMTRLVKDRFVVLLSQLKKAETAAIVAARMLEAVSEPFYVGQHELYLTACIGIALLPTDTKEPEMVLRYAENALYVAKQRGKHLYQFYQQALHLKSQRELLLATQLKKEIFLNELQMCYQPVVDIKTENVLCMDALLYWQHQDYGLISSRELLAFAETQRKSSMLSEWMLTKACQAFFHWQKMGIQFELLGLPLSFSQIENTQFVYDLTQLLKKLNFEPKHLLIEIKENLATVPSEKFEKAIAMLKYTGVKIAMTDFGSGFLPLSEFKNLNIDYLKLDPVFVSDLEEQPKARLLIQSMLAFAETLGIKMIVQGVESAQQVNILREMGCTLLQGQKLGAPLLEHEIEKMTLKSHSLNLKDML